MVFAVNSIGIFFQAICSHDATGDRSVGEYLGHHGISTAHRPIVSSLPERVVLYLETSCRFRTRAALVEQVACLVSCLVVVARLIRYTMVVDVLVDW